ncbi:MAG: glycosyltransferase family 4 protein [Candidatus Methanoperedens sp.]|nr:glycosyltransferase family 4 protein [Candidatus Methanoperedens sp.]
MKILQIILTTQGGLIHYTSQLSNALSTNNDVHLIAPVGFEAELFNKSINLYQLKTGDTLQNFILSFIIFTRISSFLNTIKKINPDVIHLQSNHPWMSLFLPFLQKYLIVTTIHDVNPHEGSRKFEQEISRNIHIKYSDALIVHGDAAKTILGEKIPKKKIFNIPHGDYSFFSRLKQHNYDEEKGNILFFGRIEDYKGLRYLIEAIPQIEKNIPNIKIVIAGSGSLEGYNLESKNVIIYNHYIPDNEVGAFFQKAAVVVLPYIEGTQTGIIPIAYAFKKPVIVTNVGSIPEVVENGKTGFIVPSKDPKALAEAIVKILMDDNLRKKMGENGYRKMMEELSWDKIAEMTIEVYKKILYLEGAKKLNDKDT